MTGIFGCDQGSARDLIHRWSTAGRGTLSRPTKYIPMSKERCTLYSEVHSYNRGALYSVFVYIDGTPQNAVHCSAMYIPMVAERCTLYSEVHSYDRGALYTVQRSTFL